MATEAKRSVQVQASLWRRMARLKMIGATLALLAYAAMLGIYPESMSSISLGQVQPNAQFDLTIAKINVQEIRSGGPPKDGIPAISNAMFVAGPQSEHMQPFYRVIGVHLEGEFRAYPLTILNYHEVINDTIGNSKIAVTYCPLCDSAVVFDRRTPVGEREFGVSGLLYNSNVLIYDRGGKPESLWSQVQGRGVTGPAAGTALKAVPCELTTWASWSKRHPETTVMSFDTGHQREYRINPYQPYFQLDGLMFPATPANPRFLNKERVLGVWIGDQYRAYPEAGFPADQDQIEDTIGDKKLTISLDRETRSIRVVQADEGVSWLYSFWFAWYALHPETTVYGQ